MSALFNPDPEPVKFLPFQIHSQTSADAAHSMKSLAGAMRERVYEAIVGSMNGLTDEQISTVTGIKADTVRPRRGELQKAGRIIECGTRKVRSGRMAVVWCPRRVNDQDN